MANFGKFYIYELYVHIICVLKCSKIRISRKGSCLELFLLMAIGLSLFAVIKFLRLLFQGDEKF